MFDKDNKFGFINNNESNNNNNNNIKDTDLPHTVSSKVLGTVPASNITDNIADSDERLLPPISINNASINKDRRYYIEFLGSKKLCSLLISEEQGNCIICSIGNYNIQAFEDDSSNILISIEKININDTTTTVTFTDLVIYEEEVKYLDSKYLDTDLVLQNSISLGRVGDIGTGSSAIGIDVIASGNYGAHAEGSYTIASGDSSHAEGSSTIASGDSSHAEGGSTASGDSSHAEGSNTIASGRFSHTEGKNTEASGTSSHAEGLNTIASSENQHVQGRYNIEDTANKYAHIVGNGASNSKRANAHTLDWGGNAWYSGQVEGTNLPYTVSSKVLTTVTASNIKLDDTITVNNISINKDRRYYIEFLGSKKLCSLVISEEMGNFIICSIGNYNIQAFEDDSSNLSMYITKINRADTTTDTFTNLILYEEEVKYLDSKYIENDLVLQSSISLGRVGAIGYGSSAVGSSVIASDYCSHAEGNTTTASGDSSHAEGGYTTASGDSSHAEGSHTKALGDYSHSEGNTTTASGECSHAEGSNTIASSQNQHVQGRYNIEDKANKYAHIVGNGGLINKSNAHTLDWNGNAWYSGKVTAGATPVEDMDLTTKKYVDDKVSSLPQFSFNESGELVVTINGVSKTFVPKSE